MTEIKYTTSQRLIEAMAARHMTQADIVKQAQPYCEARNLKLNKSDVSQFVHGKVIPSQWKISILANALNVSEAWLLGYDVPMDRGTSADLSMEKALGINRELDERLIEQLMVLPEERVQFVLDFLKLPPNQAQRVIDFLAGLKAAEQD